jgi:hypothetical protein
MASPPVKKSADLAPELAEKLTTLLRSGEPLPQDVLDILDLPESMCQQMTAS